MGQIKVYLKLAPHAIAFDDELNHEGFLIRIVSLNNSYKTVIELFETFDDAKIYKIELT